MRLHEHKTFIIKSKSKIMVILSFSLLLICSGCSFEATITKASQNSEALQTPPLLLQYNGETEFDIDLGEPVSVDVSGGRPPYQWELLGPGSFDSESMTYASPSSSSDEAGMLQVTDSLGLMSFIKFFYRTFRIETQLKTKDSYGLTITDLATAPNGDLYIVGFSGNPSNSGAWFVKKRDYNQSEMKTVDTFAVDGGQEPQAQKIWIKDNNTIFVSGYSDDPADTAVRKSIDGGITWNTIILITDNSEAFPSQITSDSSGTIYRTAASYVSTNVLKSNDDGASWSSSLNLSSDIYPAFYNNVQDSTLFLGTQSSNNAKLRKSTDGGNNWSVIDNYTSSPSPAYIMSIFTKNNVYCWVGRAGNSMNNTKWQTRCSTDAGVTWATRENFTRGAYTYAYASNVVIDSSNDIYVLGTYRSGLSTFSKLLRKSSDNGVSWADVTLPAGYLITTLKLSPDGHPLLIGQDSNTDNVILQSTDGGASWLESTKILNDVFLESSGSGLVQDTNGNILMIGGDQYPWEIKKSTDFGLTWNTINDISPSTHPYKAKIESLSNGRLLVYGNYQDASYKFHWIIKASDDFGQTWSTVDDFMCTVGVSGPSSLTQDKNGQLFLAGSCNDISNSNKVGLIRKSSDWGQTWQTVGTIQLATNKDSYFTDIKFNDGGKIFAIGIGTDSSDIAHWILYKTDDFGTTWQNIPNDFILSNSIYNGQVLLLTPSEKELLATGISRVDSQDVWLTVYSGDNGETWEIVNSQATESGWFFSNPTGLISTTDGVYISASSYSIPDYLHNKTTIKKSRDFKTWSTLYSEQGFNSSTLTQCGSGKKEICAIGSSQVSYFRNIWSTLKLSK